MKRPATGTGRSGLLTRTRGFEQEPGTALRLVDPNLNQACSGDIAVFIAQIVRLAHARYQLLIVVTQFGEHVLWRNEIRVIVGDALQTSDVADRTQRSAANFAHPFGNGIGGRKNLLALLV